MEGLLGAFTIVMLVSVAFFYIGNTWPDNSYCLQLPLADYLFLGVCSSLLAVLGDLIESFLKRCSNMDDSGRSLGSHGGMFDRIDSMLLIAFLKINFPDGALHPMVCFAV